MTIKAKLTSEEFEALDETLREHYTPLEDTGEYLLAVEASEDGYELSDIRGLKSALDKERENYRGAKRKLAEMEEEAEARIAELEDNVPQTRAEAKKVAQQVLAHVKDSQIAKAMLAGDARPGLALVLDKIAQTRVDAEDNVSVVVPVTVDEDTTKDIALPEFLEELRNACYDDTHAYHKQLGAELMSVAMENLITRARSGAGTPPGSKATGKHVVQSKWAGKTRSQMTRREKVDAIREMGEEKYLRLPR